MTEFERYSALAMHRAQQGIQLYEEGRFEESAASFEEAAHYAAIASRLARAPETVQ